MARLYTISKALSIGMHVCAYLASEKDCYTSTRKVAEIFGFSAHHVTKVIQKLGQAGVILTVRGAKGGFRLARAPEEISLLDIADALGTTPTKGCLLHPTVCSGQQCLLGELLHNQNQNLRELMGKASIKELAESFKVSDCSSQAAPFMKQSKK